MDLIKTVLIAVLSVAALFVITKLMGHKQIAQLDFFDYVSGITIGSIGAELATELESPERPLIALAVYGILSLGLSFITLKMPRSRRYINGSPTVLLDNGRLYRKNLSLAKLDLSEFIMLCREQGYFDIKDIQTAVFENNGKLSILPKAKNRPLTPGDVGVEAKQDYVTTEVIMDGRVMEENLKRIGKDAGWLRQNLEARGYNSPKKILLGIYRTEEDNLTLYPNE